MKETALVKDIQTSLSQGDVRLWRNNVGEGWVGRSYRCVHGLCIPDPIRINFGLAVGSSDLIGFKSVLVTQEMVGTRVAIFASLEVKTRFGKVTEAQVNWLNMIDRFGGIRGVGRSVEDALVVFCE